MCQICPDNPSVMNTNWIKMKHNAASPWSFHSKHMVTFCFIKLGSNLPTCVLYVCLCSSTHTKMHFQHVLAQFYLKVKKGKKRPNKIPYTAQRARHISDALVIQFLVRFRRVFISRSQSPVLHCTAF